MTNQQITQLNTNGWIEIESITDDEILIDLSKKFGQIIKHPNGNEIDHLKPKDSSVAIKNTFSHKYEFDEFPFHTDTAFWNLPARYVLMSCQGLSNTGTTFLTFDDMYRTLNPQEIIDFKKSIFLIKTPTKKFYSSLINIYANQTFIRFDTNCMTPINKSANKTIEIIDNKTNQLNINKIMWDRPKVFIFDNWRIIHGRESVKNDENRILKRIYIK
jgi:alpha-ketoglutarate-dependent taurine dioxygenase